MLFVPFAKNVFSYGEIPGTNDAELAKSGDGIIIPVSKRRYFCADCSKDELIRAFENASLIS